MQLDLFYIRHNKNTPTYALAQTVLSSYDLTIVLKGRLEYVIDRKPITLTEKQALFLCPGTERARSGVSDNVDFISFNFFSGGEISLPQYIKNVDAPEISALIAACDALSEPFEPLQKQILQHVLCSLLLSLQRNLDRENLSKITRAILGYLQHHYREKLTVTEICNGVFSSKTHCSRIFKADTGRSIVDYLLDLKTEKAKELLAENSLSLTQVAQFVGYDDYNYFAHMFKTRTGCSPSAYHKRLQSLPLSDGER